MPTLKITGDDKDAQKSLARMQNRLSQLEDKLRKVTEEGKRGGKSVGDAFDPRRVTAFVGSLVGVAGVTGALARIIQGHETWAQNLREIATEARRAAGEYVALADLQARGMKAGRVRRAAAAAAAYGVTERGIAFDTVQALQSAIAEARPELTEAQQFEAGLAAARTIFAGTQRAIPIELGKELEVLGAAFGLQPGEAIRKAFVAGQLSGRGPRELAGAAPAMGFFEDKDLFFAIASKLAGAVKAEELGTYMKAAGMALGAAAPEAFKATVAGLGLPEDATKLDKLRALRDAQIDTGEKLVSAGLTELRQRQALVALVPRVSGIEAAYQRIPAEGRPGVFLRAREALERELPAARAARRAATLEAEFADITAFGPADLRALTQEQRERVRAIEFRRRGLEESQIFGLDYIGAEGRVSDFAYLRALTMPSVADFWRQERLDFAITAIVERIGHSQNAIVRLLEEMAVYRAGQEPFGDPARGELNEWREALDAQRRAAESLERGAKAQPALMDPGR